MVTRAEESGAHGLLIQLWGSLIDSDALLSFSNYLSLQLNCLYLPRYSLLIKIEIWQLYVLLFSPHLRWVELNFYDSWNVWLPITCLEEVERALDMHLISWYSPPMPTLSTKEKIKEKNKKLYQLKPIAKNAWATIIFIISLLLI